MKLKTGLYKKYEEDFIKSRIRNLNIFRGYEISDSKVLELSGLKLFVICILKLSGKILEAILYLGLIILACAGLIALLMPESREILFGILKL